MPAEPAVTESVSQTTQPNSEALESQSLPHPTANVNEGDLMDRLGIPQAMRPKEVAQETEVPAVADEELPPVTAEEEAEPSVQAEGEEAEPEVKQDKDEAEEDEESEEHDDPRIQKVHQRNAKLRKRAQRAEDRADEAEAKLAQYELQPPVTINPTMQDPLAHVHTPAELKEERKQFKLLRDMARRKPDGWIANEGTPQEAVITREQAQDYLSWAEDVLNEQIPAKELEIKETRPAARHNAEKIMPDMFNRGTEDYQAANTVWRNFPAIATHPMRDELTAVLLRGFKDIAKEQSKPNGKNGSLDQVPEKILKAREQREKTPVQKQTPPGPPARVNGAPATEKMGRAMDKLAKTGSPNDTKEALRVLNTLGAEQRNGRDLVPA